MFFPFVFCSIFLFCFSYAKMYKMSIQYSFYKNGNYKRRNATKTWSLIKVIFLVLIYPVHIAQEK